MTSRTSKSPASTSHITGAGMRRRPVTQLLTIEETAQLWKVSPRTVRRQAEANLEETA
jgi:hypothetical protein